MMTWRNAVKTKNEIMPLVTTSHTVIVFDTETTGLGKTAKIIQFSGIKYSITKDLKLVPEERVDFYINPEEPLEPKITEITGITNELLKNAPNERKRFGQIKEFLESADFLAAYNCGFDLRMIRQMEERVGHRIYEGPCIDVLKIARDLISKDKLESHKLGSVVGYLFPTQEFAFHSAIEDVQATALCFESFLKTLEGLEESEDKQDAFLEWASFFINPRAKSQKRIRLKLNLGEYGDIFWDVVKKCWSCKRDKKAQKLFENLNLAGIERQLLNKYGWKYHANDMETLAYNWEQVKKAS